MSELERFPLLPSEFDLACRQLVARCPWLSETSGRRTVKRNRDIGGNPRSKHLLGMARDFVAEPAPGLDRYAEAAGAAAELGLWWKIGDRVPGSGGYLHVQGLPPGALPVWWHLRFGDGFDLSGLPLAGAASEREA